MDVPPPVLFIPPVVPVSLHILLYFMTVALLLFAPSTKATYGILLESSPKDTNHALPLENTGFPTVTQDEPLYFITVLYRYLRSQKRPHAEHHLNLKKTTCHRY